jgi:hypothetical protein
MDMIATVAFLGGIAFGLIVLGAIVLAFWRGSASDAPVLLYEMLRRQGPAAACLAVSSGNRGFALAVKQCLHCQSTARCRAWLDAGNREGFDQFCANAGYVSRMRSLGAVIRAPRWT